MYIVIFLKYFPFNHGGAHGCKKRNNIFLVIFFWYTYKVKKFEKTEKKKYDEQEQKRNKQI